MPPTTDKNCKEYPLRGTFVIDEFNTEHQFILDALVEGIYGIDAEGTITFCNDALSRMTGHSKEEIVGQNAHDLLHQSRVDGKGCPREECDLPKAILGGELRQVVGGTLWKKDGSSIPVEYCE